MDQSRCLQGLTGHLAGKPLRGQPAQLVIDERQELLGRGLVALLYGLQNAGDLAECLAQMAPR